MNLKRLFILISGLMALIFLVLGFNIYTRIYSPNTADDGYIYIPTNNNFTMVKALIRPYLKRTKPFEWTAKKKHYISNIKPGKYHITKGMNNNDLINLLRSGNQIPVKVSFNNQDSFEKLAGRISHQIEADSISILKSITDKSFLTETNFNSLTALAMYLPNSYEFYWNTSAETFRKKMYTAYKNFWNTNRIAKAKTFNLTPIQVITLASIVQKETANIAERPKVARLYLNRLQYNWPLQADPTIIFALKKNDHKHDTVIKRVLTKDLEINSPYNTYKNIGLPPGPIGMPDLSSINAVLNPSKHNYFYMCASITKIGTHEFAKTLAQHNRNAVKYQKWLSKQGVNR